MAVIVGVDGEKLARKVGDLFVKLHLRVYAKTFRVNVIPSRGLTPQA
jgi:hypothetical protein